MVSLLRNGPRIILIQSSEQLALKEALIHNFHTIVSDWDNAFEKSNEFCTIIYLTDNLSSTIRYDSRYEVVAVLDEPEHVLINLFQEPYRSLITAIRPAPHIVIMRAVDNLSTVLDEVRKDLGGQIGSFSDILDQGNDQTTLLALTDKPLNRNLIISDFYPQFLKLEGKYHDLLKELRMHALKYLNSGIGKRDWNEIEIRIFDRYSAYKLHYERLIEVFESLELGFVLGESWSKDYPRFMMSVEVYRVRFFTFHDPKLIKQLLLGLEYLEDGTRIVDYDVYYNHKKIDWTDALEKGDPKGRNVAALLYRKRIVDRLTEDTIQSLKQYEAAILKTRD